METFSALLAICAGNSPVPGEFPHKGQWRWALMFSLICVWINGWVNIRDAGVLRRNQAHYDVIVMLLLLGHSQWHTHALHWCAESRHQHVDTVGQLRAHTGRRKCLFFILFGESVLYQQTLHPPLGRITGLLWRWLRRFVGYRHVGISSGYYWGWWKRKLRFCQWIAPQKSEKMTRKFQSALSCTS